uniref:Uncharacterized protein n=1 Tax=Arundo donax TaxID=35708 RepID=A0A0A9EIQ8_ARUDO
MVETTDVELNTNTWQKNCVQTKP